MTQQKESVVTPGRFDQGMTYAQWMDYIKLNKPKFEDNYQKTELSKEDAQAFRDLATAPNGPVKMLVIGEDWCPDVFRGLPVLARIAEAGGIELRVFPKDENLDIMSEFLKDGEFQSIPTVVFYDKDHNYICHWIERPAIANKEVHLMHQIYEGKSREEAMPELIRFQQGPIWANWRKATVTEVRELLESHSK